MKFKLFSFIFISLTLTSCKEHDNNRLNEIYNMQIVDEFRDDDQPNKNVEDNIIYTAKKTFQYNYNYIRNGEMSKFQFIFNSDCLNNRRVNCFSNIIIPSNNDSINNNYTIDYLTLVTYQTKGYTSLSNNQSIVRYDYYNNKKGKIMFGEKTGVKENKNKIFLHPPRSYAFSILEFSPFPYLEYPLKANKTWTIFNSVPERTLSKILSQLDISQSNQTSVDLDFFYEVESKVNYSSSFGEIKCWKINAVGEDEKYYSSATFLFNEEYGFVKLTYDFFNGDHLELKLDQIL